MHPLTLVILFDKLWSMYIVLGFPGVMRLRVPFPTDTILFLPFLAKVVHPDDGIYFPFGFSLPMMSGGGFKKLGPYSLVSLYGER